MTPLCVTKTGGEGSLGRLAPLPAPKFRSGRSRGETEGLLRSEAATLARLRIDKEGDNAVPGEEEEAVDVSPGGHITKRLARSRPVSQELMDSANASSQVSHLSLRQTLFLKNYFFNWSSHYFKRCPQQSPSTKPTNPVLPSQPHGRAPHPQLPPP